MKMIPGRSRFLGTQAGLCLACLFFLASACASPDLYRPGSDGVSLWRSEIIPVSAQWSYVGTQKVMVRGQVWEALLPSNDDMETLVFLRHDQNAPSLLLLSRVIKTKDLEIFTHLGGDKTNLNGLVYREARYGLDSNSTDPEYRRYFDLARQSGATLAPSYEVRVLDRLPLNTVLVRVMELTPGRTEPPLPPFGKLYPQEREEGLLRQFP